MILYRPVGTKELEWIKTVVYNFFEVEYGTGKCNY